MPHHLTTYSINNTNTANNNNLDHNHNQHLTTLDQLNIPNHSQHDYLYTNINTPLSLTTPTLTLTHVSTLSVGLTHSCVT